MLHVELSRYEGERIAFVGTKLRDIAHVNVPDLTIGSIGEPEHPLDGAHELRLQDADAERFVELPDIGRTAELAELDAAANN